MKIILFHHLKNWYNLSYPVLFCYQGLLQNKQLFDHNGIELTSFATFLSGKDQDFLQDANENNREIDYSSFVVKACSNLADRMRDSSEFDKAIFIGFQFVGFDLFFSSYTNSKYNFRNLFYAKKCKLFMWLDDLHSFREFPTHTDFMPDKNYTKCKDIKLDLIDLILSPSKHYFQSIGSPYADKTIFYFYSLNENWYHEITMDNFLERKPKILLSGARSAYPLRKQIHDMSKTDFVSVVSVLESPGYDRTAPDFFSKVGLEYLKIISSYKGAFFTYAKKPLDFNLAKIIEILMCGTLGFFEYSPLLETELGLKEFVHYIPITKNDGTFITDAKYYFHFMEIGQNIAREGCRHVRKNFSSYQRSLQLIDICKKFEKNPPSQLEIKVNNYHLPIHFINYKDMQIKHEKDKIVFYEIKYCSSFGILIPKPIEKDKETYSIEIDFVVTNKNNKYIKKCSIFDGKKWIRETAEKKFDISFETTSKPRINFESVRNGNIREIKFFFVI